MEKRHKILIAVILILVVLFGLDRLNEHLHVKLLNKFTNNYTYLPLSQHKNNGFKKRYYCEYVDSFERMWYQYEKLDFINDSTFQISTKSTYFMGYFFPVKYYLGILDLKQWNNNVQNKYIIRDKNIFTAQTDSLVGTFKETERENNIQI